MRDRMRSKAGQVDHWAGLCIWGRHGAAVVLTLVVNGALVLFLASRGGRAARMLPRELRTLPIDVISIHDRAPRVTPRQQPVRASEVRLAPAELPALPPVAMPRLELVTAGLNSTGIALPSYTPGGPFVSPGVPVPVLVEGAVVLTKSASLIRPPDLSLYYPYRARLRGIAGQTRLNLEVDARGRVTSVRVLRSTPGGVFETAARRAGRSLRFQPALERGQATAASVEVSLVWRLK